MWHLLNHRSILKHKYCVVLLLLSTRSWDCIEQLPGVNVCSCIILDYFLSDEKTFHNAGRFFCDVFLKTNHLTGVVCTKACYFIHSNNRRQSGQSCTSHFSWPLAPLFPSQPLFQQPKPIQQNRRCINEYFIVSLQNKLYFIRISVISSTAVKHYKPNHSFSVRSLR